MRAAPRLFFSFRSPFSWLAVHQLERQLPGVLGRIDLVPFWEPDARTRRAMDERGIELHYADMSKAKHLYILQDTKRLAGRMGMRIAWPVDVEPWWEPSHLGWLRARRLGRSADFYAAVTAARWERGEDISKPDVIRALAASIGLDGGAVACAVDDPEVRAEGVDCLARAYEEDVFGVPYLRLGWQRFWGVDRVDDFVRAYSAAATGGDPLAGVPAALRSPARAYDTDTAGGCG